VGLVGGTEGGVPLRLIAIGGSTGAAEALIELLPKFSADFPPVVIAIHMPADFTGKFARRLDGLCPMRVKEAQGDTTLQPGQVLLARGDANLKVIAVAKRLVARVEPAKPGALYRPSVDRLFETTARAARGNALGLILTGMGRDGAEGLLKMRQAGAHTIAQDEASSVIFGMPREAIQRGASCEVRSLNTMVTACRRWVERWPAGSADRSAGAPHSSSDPNTASNSDPGATNASAGG
jgi:two-component system chemotaxis response regulator CheB